MTDPTAGQQFGDFINGQLNGPPPTERQNSAAAIAQEYGLDANAADALAHASDEQAMRSLAKRLSPTHVGTLRPDMSQGGRQAPATQPTAGAAFAAWLRREL